MLLHQNSLMALHLDQKTNILNIQWQQVREPENISLEHSFRLIRGAIQSEEVSLVLIQTASTDTNAEAPLLNQIIDKYSLAFSGTGVKKVAAVLTYFELQNTAPTKTPEQQTTAAANFQVQHFPDSQKAINWLLKTT